jgi:hypothetical protein
MAVPLNTFTTRNAVLTTDPVVIYTAPANVSAIVLMAQLANVSEVPVAATFIHNDGVLNTELISDYMIPPNDASSALTGKLVLQTGQKIIAFANENNKIKLTLSILESANE